MSGPSPVRITKANDVKTNHGQTEGMIRQSAVVNISPNQQIVGTLMRAQPHSSSGVHHHGTQDTIVYAVSGSGLIVSEGGGKRDRLDPGDWAIIPQGREHQEANDGDDEVVWVICRAPGGLPEVVNLTGWGGDKME
ncbi:hypothetical protein NKR23_g9340 [Pleurostoma richardsiae]|uniref:Cupin type-2 domain-containing protein n=1 Tax=Pleurostoma richardsiae TaxID=41990 RepID=A0AA38VN29_9PEZI|nr:hypothetical protein NKR23_g9340 [Pleurostoma richardsiae]